MMETTDNTFSKLNVICSKLEYEIRKVAGDKYDDQLSNFKAQAIALPSPEAELALKLLEKYVDIVQKSGGSDNSDSKEKLSPISILKWIFAIPPRPLGPSDVLASNIFWLKISLLVFSILCFSLMSGVRGIDEPRYRSTVS